MSGLEHVTLAWFAQRLAKLRLSKLIVQRIDRLWSVAAFTIEGADDAIRGTGDTLEAAFNAFLIKVEILGVGADN
jgi:hypothetical protein